MSKYRHHGSHELLTELTNVACRNWQAWKEMGIGGVLSPGSYHIGVQLDYPVSLGDYSSSAGPDQPSPLQ
jgi:hypothetical protein